MPTTRAGRRLPEPDGFDDEDGTETITFLDEAEFDLIHEEMGFDPDAQDFLTAKVGTGARFSELTAVECRDVKLDARPRTCGSTERGSATAAMTTRSRGRAAATGASRSRRPDGAGSPRPGRRGRVPPPDGREGTYRPRVHRPAGRGDAHSHFYNRRWVKAVRAAQKRGLTKSPRLVQEAASDLGDAA